MEPEDLIANLLADKSPVAARDAMLAWSEARSSSWADANRDAESRSASGGHLPQIRGQLRYHLGQKALVSACRSAGVGSIPMRTVPAGGTFIVARIGRFALVSMSVQRKTLMPRRSITRTMLSQANESLVPQQQLFETASPQRDVTELAYFGCLVAVPNLRDPTVPAELGLAVPNVGISDWVSWIPLYRLHGMLQSRVDAGSQSDMDQQIPDLAFPKFRLPKNRKDTGDDEA